MIRKELDLNEFREFISGKKIVCFGAGLQSVRFINILENWKKTDDILAFIDNNLDKQGKKVEYEEFSYPIMSIIDAFKLFQNEVVLVITCLDVINVRNQLDQYHELDQFFCFSMAELAQKELTISDYDSVACDYEMPVIPKRIHYCWFGNKMPVSLRKNIDKWKKMCPDYEIIEWNESNYDISKNRYIKQAYDRKKWAYVSDYVRLDLIYQYGGIYLDTDVEMLKRPDDLLYQDSFACFDGTLLVNSGAGIGGKAGGNIIKVLREYYDNIEFDYSDGEYNKIPCTTHTYNVLKKYGLHINDTFQKVGDMNIYPMIFQGTCINTKQMRITKKTFFLHYGTMSWLDEKSNLIRNHLGSIFTSDCNDGLKNYLI